MSVLLFNNQCKRSVAQRSDVCLHFVTSAKEVVLSPVSGWWSVGLSAGSNKNYQADFHEAWMEDGPHQPLVWHCERGCFFNSLINFSGIMYGSWWKKLSWAPWGFRYLWVVQFDTDLKVFTKDGPFSAATLTNLISIFINLLFFHNTLEIRTQSTLFCCASSQLLKIWWS